MLIAETTRLNFVGNYTEYVQSTAVVAADTRLQVDQTSLRAPPVA
jgi:hypothetical protein